MMSALQLQFAAQNEAVSVIAVQSLGHLAWTFILMFYGMFMPIGLVMRLFGKDGMARKLDEAAESYRVESAKPPAKNLEKPF